MSEALTLARPYARAAFDLAAQAAAASAWSKALAASAAIAAEDRIASLLEDPRLPLAERAAVVTPDGVLPAGYAQFLALMAENSRLRLLPEVAQLFETLRAEAEQSLTVKVRTALPLAPEQRDRLVSQLARRFGRTVSLDVELDEALIAGAVIDAGQLVIDGSLSAQLDRLRKELTA
jgi:F-type H+-transporting ATPase subunit delta